jgi:hypothetical protein
MVAWRVVVERFRKLAVDCAVSGFVVDLVAVLLSLWLQGAGLFIA